MSRHLDSSTKAQMAQIMVQYGRSGRFSRKESVRSLFGRTVLGKAIWESSIGTLLGKIFEMGMFICQPSKRIILIRVCGRYQTGRQYRKHKTDLENSHGRRWPGRTNIISWPWKFWVARKESVKSARILFRQKCLPTGFLFWGPNFRISKIYLPDSFPEGVIFQSGKKKSETGLIPGVPFFSQVKILYFFIFWIFSCL